MPVTSSVEVVVRDTCTAQPPSVAVLQRRRLQSAWLGGSLGAWWAVCLIGAAFAERALWRIVPGEIGQSGGVGILAFTRFAGECNLAPISLLVEGGVLVVGSGALVGYLVTAIGQGLRLDPDRHSRRALWDALAQWRSPLLWTSPFLIAIAITVWRESGGGSLDFVAPIVAIVATFAVPMLAPFLVYDRRVLEAPSPRRLWVPRWPGWRVVLAGLAIALLDPALATILEIAGTAAPVAGQALIVALSTIIDVALATLLCIAWIDREGFRAFVLPWTSSSVRSAFGPQFALCVRVAYLGLCLLPLLILPFVFAIFVLPQVENALQNVGMASPSHFRLARAVRLEVTNPIVAVTALMVAPLLAFATARTYVLSSSTVPCN